MKKTLISPFLLLAAAAISTALVAFSLPKKSLPRPVAPDQTLPEFLAQFPLENLPYAFTKETILVQLKKLNEAHTPTLVDELGYAGSLDMSYVGKQLEKQRDHGLQMDMERYSRIPEYREPVAHFETEQHFAALIKIKRGRRHQALWGYEIAVFDKKDQFVNLIMLGGVYTSQATAFTIDPNLQAVLQHYEVDWQDADPKREAWKLKGLSPIREQVMDLTLVERAAKKETWIDPMSNPAAPMAPAAQPNIPKKATDGAD